MSDLQVVKRNKNVKKYDVDYKILIIGESRVGKTSIIKRINKENFNENTISTVGIDFVNAYFLIDGVTVRLQIWDTAGQERFRTITRSHFRNTKGIILAYDITCKESFEKLEYWIHSFISMRMDTETIYLVGNKIDLESEREVTRQQGLKFANMNLLKFFETSAKTGENIYEVFNSLAFDILDSNDMQKMNRYRSVSVGDSFVYSYNMPSEIVVKSENQVQKKRKLILPFRKKMKYKAPLAKSLDQLNTKINYSASNQTVKIKLKPEKKLKEKKKSKKKSKKSTNCCKIS